jgi:hypothetical protein
VPILPKCEIYMGFDQAAEAGLGPMKLKAAASAEKAHHGRSAAHHETHRSEVTEGGVLAKRFMSFGRPVTMGSFRETVKGVQLRTKVSGRRRTSDRSDFGLSATRVGKHP